MRFSGKDSHVRRLTKAESMELGIAPSKESYVVKQTYTDPFEGKTYRKGDVISNRQGRNVQAQETGSYKSYSQYTRIWAPSARRSDKDVRLRNAWIRKASKERGISKERLRTDPKFRQAFTEWRIISKEDRKNVKPNSPLAKMLVAAGLRKETDTHNVGETPKKKGAKR